MGNTAVAAAVADASLLATNQIIQKFHPLVIPLVISSSCSLSSFWQKTLYLLYTQCILDQYHVLCQIHLSIYPLITA